MRHIPVILVSVDGTGQNGGLEALRRSCLSASYDAVVLCSPVMPEGVDQGWLWWQIGVLGSIADYSRWMLKEFWRMPWLSGSNSHILVVQRDGYVLRPEMWRNEWLDNDFIGARWHREPCAGVGLVGNGGFSMRSQGFQAAVGDAATAVADEELRPEDVFMAGLRGWSRPSPQECDAFSVELPTLMPLGFGFHGKWFVGYADGVTA